MTELNAEVAAGELAIGDYLYDPIKSGTHNQRVYVQWTGRHQARKRMYVAGIEEHSLHPVTLAYDDIEIVKIYRDGGVGPQE